MPILLPDLKGRQRPLPLGFEDAMLGVGYFISNDVFLLVVADQVTFEAVAAALLA